MDPITDLQTENLMLRHVLEHLWANYIWDRSDTPVEAADVIGEQMLQDIERIYSSSVVTHREELHITLQGILHHEEDFWKSVSERVRQRQIRELSQRSGETE